MARDASEFQLTGKFDSLPSVRARHSAVRVASVVYDVDWIACYGRLRYINYNLKHCMGIRTIHRRIGLRQLCGIGGCHTQGSIGYVDIRFGKGASIHTDSHPLLLLLAGLL